MVWGSAGWLVAQAVPQAQQLDLGHASDWAVVVGIGISVVTLVAAVWKLARAAVRIESAVEILAKQHAEYAQRFHEQGELFQTFQRETTSSINELRMAVSRLTWQVDQRNGGRDKQDE